MSLNYYDHYNIIRYYAHTMVLCVSNGVQVL